MSVAVDTSSESHTGSSGSTTSADIAWNHSGRATGSGGVQGVFVFVFLNADADQIDAVTYGGVALEQIDEAADTAGEPGRATLFFNGDPTAVLDGTQEVRIDRNGTSEMYAVCVTLTAGGPVRIHTAGITKQTTDGTLAAQSITDGSDGVGNSMRFAGINSGLAAVPTPSSSTALQSIDFGQRVIAVVRETTAGTGSRSVGWSDASSDDRAAIYFAVKEITEKTASDSGAGSDTSALAATASGADSGNADVPASAGSSGDTGYQLPDSGTSLDTGVTAWTNPGNVTADDAAVASTSTTGAQSSDRLAVTDFDLDLPVGTNPVGIEVEYEVTLTGAGTGTLSVGLTKDGSTVLSGSPKTSASSGVRTMGGATDLWGQSGLTDADVESVNFGVMVTLVGASGSIAAQLDYVKVKVYYAAASPTMAPTAAASVSQAGSTDAWSNPANAKTDDGSSASVLLDPLSFGDLSEYLALTDFDFVAIGDEVVGIEIQIEISGSYTLGLFAYLTVDGTTPVGDAQILDPTPGTYVIGGADDTWGATLTTEDVESATFGVLIYGDTNV